jgi:hypothetical protein
MVDPNSERLSNGLAADPTKKAVWKPWFSYGLAMVCGLLSCGSSTV